MINRDIIKIFNEVPIYSFPIVKRFYGDHICFILVLVERIFLKYQSLSTSVVCEGLNDSLETYTFLVPSFLELFHQSWAFHFCTSLFCLRTTPNPQQTDMLEDLKYNCVNKSCHNILYGQEVTLWSLTPLYLTMQVDIAVKLWLETPSCFLFKRPFYAFCREGWMVWNNRASWKF